MKNKRSKGAQLIKYFLKHRFRFIILGIVNTLIMIFLTVLFQKLYYLPGNDLFIFQWGPVIKQYILKSDSKIREDIVLINTSYSKMLVENKEGNYPKGNIAITDRNCLIDLFNTIKLTASHKYILCDIIFDKQSPYDDSLKTALENTPRLVIPFTDGKNEDIFQSARIKRGDAHIKNFNNLYFKTRLYSYSRNQKSIPLVMFEEIDSTNFKTGRILSKDNHGIRLNNFAPEIRVSQRDLEKEKYFVYELLDMKGASPEFIGSLIQNKIVIIGDFADGDLKNTILGAMSGSLVLLNAYFGLHYNDNVLSVWFLLFLSIIYFISSLVVLYPQKKLDTLFRNSSKFKVLLNLLSLTGIIWLVYAISYFGFGININFTYVGMLFLLENYLFSLKYYLSNFSKSYLT